MGEVEGRGGSPKGLPGADAPECECLHFREVAPQPPIARKNKHHRWWSCIDCGERAVLRATVHEWVRLQYGRWRRKVRSA